MISAFSPLTRRVLAVGLLVLALLLLLQLVVVPLFTIIGAQRDELATLRGRVAHLKAVDRQAVPPLSTIPPHSTIRAAGAAAAQQRLRLAIGQAATAASVEIHGLMFRPSAADAPQLMRVEVNISGSEEGLLRFAQMIEQGDPLIRFERWTLQAPATPGQPIILSGRIAAVWEHEG